MIAIQNIHEVHITMDNLQTLGGRFVFNILLTEKKPEPFDRTDRRHHARTIDMNTIQRSSYYNIHIFARIVALKQPTLLFG
jgi:hypothetical protein